ncbi:MAG: hypothetical protein IJ752_09355 [Alphaproteobacteria bacterium]|nr:hypothetical protein [Alphaproteobacteria bacterium]
MFFYRNNNQNRLNKEKLQEQNENNENTQATDFDPPADYSKAAFEKIKQLCDQFNKAQLLEYIELVNSPKKLFWLNFLSGLAKGLGLTIGTAIVLTILFKLTQHIIALNIPYITVWVSEWIGQVTSLLRAGK